MPAYGAVAQQEMMLRAHLFQGDKKHNKRGMRCQLEGTRTTKVLPYLELLRPWRESLLHEIKVLLDF